MELCCEQLYIIGQAFLFVRLQVIFEFSVFRLEWQKFEHGIELNGLNKTSYSDD